jgi:hypothetical protein
MASGPPIIPAGIQKALNTFLDHEVNGPPIAAIPGEPVIPSDPVFGTPPGMQIFQVHFGLSDTTVDLLGVAGHPHDPLIG